uniref:Uncharacterized protein n=1 Tax=Oryza rufipogon TaxID=4529 RepID=A0A0E0NY84_ORYRU
MVLRSKLLVPTTDFYVPKGDVRVASDLDRVAAIDWSKTVFRALSDSIRCWRQNPASSIASCVVFLVMFTKDIVDKLVAADQEASRDGMPPFGNLPLRPLESTCYANKPADRGKGPMVEDIRAAAYTFPNMSTILGPHHPYPCTFIYDQTEPQTRPYPQDMWKYGSALQQRPEDRSL